MKKMSLDRNVDYWQAYIIQVHMKPICMHCQWAYVLVLIMFCAPAGYEV